MDDRHDALATATEDVNGPLATSVSVPKNHGRTPLFLAAVAAAVCLLFAAYTHHAWEDYYITFRASLNLATGHGLVFQPGERVHSFTSPLGTLLPAVFALGGGDGAASRALWGLRLVSAVVLGGAVALAWRTYVRRGVALLPAWLAALIWLLDAKTVDFAINGMESAFMVLFVVVTWWALTEHQTPRAIAAGFAGLQWTRPDGVVFVAALVVAAFVFARPRDTDERRRWWRALIGGSALALLIYLPWVLFAWSYYGSPIPHTMQAKIAHHAPAELFQALALYPWRLLFGSTALHDVFMPAYWFLGGWPDGLRWISRLLAVAAALTWALPGVRPAGRVAAAAFFLGGLYVEYLPRSPWYYPGWQALGFVSWGFLLDAAWQRTAWRSAVRVSAATLCLFQAAVLLAVARQIKTQQALIEDGLRTPIGLWLKANTQPGDRVYLEPLGYIGFFSGLKMLDYPGLASPEVVAARRAGADSHGKAIAQLQPEWLVLRPDQVGGIMAYDRLLLEQTYRLARAFDAREAIAQVATLPGRGYLQFDSVYYVYRRTH